MATAVAVSQISTDEVYRHPRLPTTKCPQEDSPGPCYWDAGWQGDGGGHSFWVGPTQCVWYLNPNIQGTCAEKIRSDTDQDGKSN